MAADRKSYLQLESGQPSLHLSEDFKIEYLHAVTEIETNPQTDERETPVVGQDSNFWKPFAGAFAGQILTSMLFTPHYYVPPVYQSGIVMTGYEGYGSTYSEADSQYTKRYQSPPPAMQNRSNGSIAHDGPDPA